MTKVRVLIENFKSFRRAELDLGRVNIVIGPPASGKTNLLEALATLGYSVKAGLEPLLDIYLRRFI